MFHSTLLFHVHAVILSVPALLIVLGLPNYARSAPPGTRPTAATSRPTTLPSPDPRYVLAQALYRDDFTGGDLSNWSAELETGGTVAAREGALDIDVPAGCTVWFRSALDGPVMIQYQAVVVRAGGSIDRVSDLNCFWQATDARNPDDFFAVRRSGKFSAYDQLRCYYVGLGGNGNTTTRFRRYIGEKNHRPLLPGHDLRAKADLLTPNAPQTIRLVSDGNFIQYWRDDRKLFEIIDEHPYTKGHFGLRTVDNHLRITHFRVFRLLPTR